MSLKVNVRLDTKVLDGIIKKSDGNMANAVAETGFTVEGKAKVKAPVDTGALRASIYTSLKGGRRGGPAMAEARERRPGVLTEELPTPLKNTTAYVGPSVEYGLAVELGSVRRAGTPYLQPAVRETEDVFRQLVKEAVNKI
jgi:hypothetical protein